MNNQVKPLTIRLSVIILYFILSCSFIGCADRPNTAPQDFQELTSFLYEHLVDEDDQELIFGVENMYDWLNANTQSVRKGYTVNTLTAEAISTTGKYSNPKDLIGGAALTAHGHNVDRLSRALGIDNVRETNGDSYVSINRTYYGDGECFARRECNTLEANSRSSTEWAGIVEIKYDTHLQFRWVNTKYGPVMLHRSYMNKKPEINLELVEPKQGYYLGIVFPPMSLNSQNTESENTEETETSPNPEISPDPQDDESSENEEVFTAEELDIDIDETVRPNNETWGKSAFLQVNWLDVDYGVLPVTEDRALEILVESLIDVAVATEKWMDKNYEIE